VTPSLCQFGRASSFSPHPFLSLRHFFLLQQEFPPPSSPKQTQAVGKNVRNISPIPFCQNHSCETPVAETWRRLGLPSQGQCPPSELPPPSISSIKLSRFFLRDPPPKGRGQKMRRAASFSSKRPPPFFSPTSTPPFFLQSFPNTLMSYLKFSLFFLFSIGPFSPALSMQTGSFLP